MATNGRSPCVASPAAKVTACCSQMPTSTNRSGWRVQKQLVPVPSGMAAVMAMTRASSSASMHRVSPNTSVKLGSAGASASLAALPVSGSKRPTPWKWVGLVSAGA